MNACCKELKFDLECFLKEMKQRKPVKVINKWNNYAPNFSVAYVANNPNPTIC